MVLAERQIIKAVFLVVVGMGRCLALRRASVDPRRASRMIDKKSAPTSEKNMLEQKDRARA
jgi:hypothetical protein